MTLLSTFVLPRAVKAFAAFPIAFEFAHSFAVLARQSHQLLFCRRAIAAAVLIKT
jgi:hypothetical protein